jgi:thiol:disulfide interchange protein DsbC
MMTETELNWGEVMKFLRGAVWCLGFVVAGAACAQTSPAPAGKPAAAKTSGKPEDVIRSRSEERMGAKVDSVKPMPFGLYEVTVGTEVYYVDPELNYVFVGRVFDAKTRVDLTSKRREDLTKVDIKQLPIEMAVKTVQGDGSRVLYTFEDPNCGFCKRLAPTLLQVKNVTIYTFLYPILSQDSMEKSKNVWCSKDRAAAWHAQMNEGKSAPAAAADCKTPLQENLELGRKLAVEGTPTIIFADGRRIPGAAPLERIEQGLNDAAQKK